MDQVNKLHFRWNQYEPNIKRGFSQLRMDEDFYDVTLACGDKTIKAHKVILGTCSAFFKSLLKSVPHPHPLLYLKGIDFQSLECVLAFMYSGEVHVKANELEHFLSTAEELQVIGLEQTTEQEDNKLFHESVHSYRETPKRSQVDQKSLSFSSPKNNEISIKEEDPECVEQEITKHEHWLDSFIVEPESHLGLMIQDLQAKKDKESCQESSLSDQEAPERVVRRKSTSSCSVSPKSKKARLQKSINAEIEEFIQTDQDTCLEMLEIEALEDIEIEVVNFKVQPELINESLDDQISKLVLPREADGKFACLQCPFSSVIKADVLRHVESKHIVTGGIPCDVCYFVCKTRHGLKMHKWRVHNRDKK